MSAGSDIDSTEFVTFHIGQRLFGARVSDVHDVFKLQAITPVPLARPDLAGLLNLRGRIVTAIDARRRLGLAPRASEVKGAIAIGIEREGENYCLIVDAVGEVMRIPTSQFEDNPVNLDPSWRDISRGVYRLEKGLMIELDLNKMLDAPGGAAAQAA
jgi:purine-binding chemotaxis protein CheW